MANLLLTWMAAGLFALVIFWGTNVPVKARTPALVWLMTVIVILNIIAQTAFFRAEQSYMELKISLPDAAAMVDSELNRVLETWAMRPGTLAQMPPAGWYRVVTSSIIHYGWLPLLINGWFIVLFGHVLEGLAGRWRFLTVAACGILLPAILDGIMRPVLTEPARFTGGASGLVYALIGAGAVRFPRARFEVALNLDARFWAVALLILFPLSLFTRYAGLGLTETIIVAGMALAFFSFQPVCRNLIVPMWVTIAFKLFVDVALIWPLNDEVMSGSVWRMGGGLVSGIICTLVMCGVVGLREKWHDKPQGRRRWKRRQPSLAELEAQAEENPEAARRFLGQRVFVGDVARVLEFYPRVVLQKFPELVLPVTEQLALGRMLQFKGRDAEALHAYENLLRNCTLDGNRWDVWLVAAELLIKVDPSRTADARKYLETFLRGEEILMRDRIEAEQLLREIPEEPGDAAEAREERAEDAASDEQPGRIEMTRSPDVRQSDASREGAGQRMKWDARLAPRTFNLTDDAQATTPQRSVATVREVLSPEEMTRSYWKVLPMESGGKLDEEKLLELKTRSRKASLTEQSSGVYGAPGPGGSAARRGGGRLANIQAIQRGPRQYGKAQKTTFSQPNAAEKLNDSNAKTPSYGAAAPGDAAEERPRIRLLKERDGQERQDDRRERANG